LTEKGVLTLFKGKAAKNIPLQVVFWPKQGEIKLSIRNLVQVSPNIAKYSKCRTSCIEHSSSISIHVFSL
jgi:hypothetical protein